MNLKRKDEIWKKDNVISEYFRYSNSGEIDDIKAQKKSRRFYIDCTAKNYSLELYRFLPKTYVGQLMIWAINSTIPDTFI